MNIEDHKLVKEAMAEKLYKIQNDKGWEIYFRPLTATNRPDENKDRVELISFYQGDPFMNPRKLTGVRKNTMQETNSKDNIEVMSVKDARECWNLWVEHGDYEVAEVEDFLKGGRSEWAGENFNYRKESKTASWSVPEDEDGNVTMNGKPCNISDISKTLKKRMYAE